jgi:predicted PurR-regulated permease PerM
MSAKDAFRNSLIFVATLALAYFVYINIDILLLVIVSAILGLALRGPVKALHQRGLSKGLSILVVYLVLIVILALLLLVILPPVFREFAPLIQDEDALVARIMQSEGQIEAFVEDNSDLEITLPDESSVRTTVSSTLRDVRSRIPALAGNFGGLLSNSVLVLVIAAYFVLYLDQAINALLQLFPTQRHEQIRQIVLEMEQSVGGYVRGSLLVATVVGILDFVILFVFRIPNAALLALIVASTTIIPVIGGYIGAIGATLTALLISPIVAIITLIVVLLVQQLENYVLSPRIIESNVNLNPIITIVSLLIGFGVAGALGALIAVPVASAVQILLRHLVIKPQIDKAAVDSAIAQS